MPRWSAERRAPCALGAGRRVMASRRAASWHVLRCGVPHRRLSALCPLALARTFFATVPPARRKGRGWPNGLRSVGCGALAALMFSIVLPVSVSKSLRSASARLSSRAQRSTERSGVVRCRPGTHVPRHHAIGTTGIHGSRLSLRSAGTTAEFGMTAEFGVASGLNGPDRVGHPPSPCHVRPPGYISLLSPILAPTR
jgi:hypothetical protein